MITEATIAESARKLIARHGANALQIARENVALAGDDPRSHDVALLVLSEIERVMGD